MLAASAAAAEHAVAGIPGFEPAAVAAAAVAVAAAAADVVPVPCRLQPHAAVAHGTLCGAFQYLVS